MSQRDQLLRAVQAARSGEELSVRVAELDAFDRQRQAQLRQSRETDLSAQAVRQALTPVPLFEHHTAATDWLGDYQAPRDYRTAMIAQASQWYRGLDPAVAADREEFLEQARGRAYTAASRYGEAALDARRTFMEYVGYLHRTAASGLPQIDQLIDPDNRPSATPYPTETFDNFAPEQDPFNSRVESPGHQSQISSEQAPLLQQVRQQDGSGSGFGSGPERPDSHTTSFDTSNSYAEVPLGPPGVIPTAAPGQMPQGQSHPNPVAGVPQTAGTPQLDADGDYDGDQDQDDDPRRRAARRTGAYTGPDQEGFRWRISAASDEAGGGDVDTMAVPYHVKCSSHHWPEQPCSRPGEHTASLAVGYAGNMEDFARQAACEAQGAAEGLLVLRAARGDLARVAAHHSQLTAAFRAQARSDEEIAWLHGYQSAVRPVLAAGGATCSECGKPVKPGKTMCKNCRQAAKQASRSRLDFQVAAEAALAKGAPFAGYEDFEDCTSENSGKRDPDAYCGEIKHRTEDKTRTGASQLPQVQQTVSPDNVPTPQADQLPPDVMFPIDPAFAQQWETGPDGAHPKGKAAARIASILLRPRSEWSAEELRFAAQYFGRTAASAECPSCGHDQHEGQCPECSCTYAGRHLIHSMRRRADYMTRPHQSTDDLAAPYNSAQTTPQPGSSNMQGGDYQAGFRDGQEDRQSGAKPTFSDNSSGVSPYVQGYAAGFGGGTPAAGAPDVPRSMGGDSGQAQNAGEAARSFQVSRGAALRRQGHDFTEEQREDAAHSLGPGHKLPVNSEQDLENAHIRAHQVEGIPESRVDAYLDRLDKEYDYHPGKSGSRLSAAFVTAQAARSPEFGKGYRFASAWKRGRRLVAIGSAAFEAGLYAGVTDRPRIQAAWVAAHAEQAVKHPQLAARMRAHADFTRRHARASGMRCHGAYLRRQAATSTDLITDGPGTSPDPMGSTPLNGPGTPPPMGGGTDPARAGGPPPYQGAEPSGSGPVAPDDVLGRPQEAPREGGPFTQTFSGTHPENATLAPAAPNAAGQPGYSNTEAYQGDPRVQRAMAAFRQRVQASLSARTAAMTEIALLRHSSIPGRPSRPGTCRSAWS